MLHEGDLLHGFIVNSIDEIDEYNGTGISCTHSATGLEVFHLRNEDPENFFALIFQTAPKNNRGAAHIVEHSVLSGSQHFPIKDPFKALLQGSAQTFLNAMTYPDKTVYPGASPIKKDYFNLFRVYGDAVFFPLMRRETFQQEGVRLTVSEAGDFTYDGIVFNEMKGAYSSHDDLVFSHSVHSLFPDTPLGFDAGGDPREIFHLTYEEFKGFHAAYYHPSNCKVYVYGNIPTEEQLEFLQKEFLNDFTSIKVDRSYTSPKRWKKPKYLTLTSPENEEEAADESTAAAADPAVTSADPTVNADPAVNSTPTVNSNPTVTSEQGSIPASESSEFSESSQSSAASQNPEKWKSSITINWLTRSALDPVNLITYDILTEILLGNPGAPVYSAVIESGLGEDISPVSGMDGELKDIVFSIGIRNSKASLRDAFEKHIFKTLKETAESGLDADTIASAIKRIEFRQRELRGGIPLGLRSMSKSLRGWLHGKHPKETLLFIPAMEKIKKLWADDPRYFSKIIEQDLLNNNHRTVVTVTPSSEHNRKFAQVIDKSLKTLQKNSSRKAIKNLQKGAEELRKFQETPDSQEAMDTVPVLHREDLPQEIRRIKTDVSSIEAEGVNVPFVYNPYHTNGIVYADLVLDVSGLSQREMRLLPLLGRLMYMTGLPGLSYHEVSKKIAHLTGGLSSYLDSGTPLGSAKALEMLVIQVKFLEEDKTEVFTLLQDILLRADLSDQQRIRSIIKEKRNDFSSSVISSGPSYTSMRAAARLSKVQAREDQWRGIDQLLYLSSLNADDAEQLEVLAEELQALRNTIMCRSRSILHLTADSEIREELKDLASGLLSSLPDSGSNKEATAEASLFHSLSKRTFSGVTTSNSKVSENHEDISLEALICPAQVASNSLVFASAEPGSADQIYQGLLANILSIDHLYEQIRIKGGAYGAFCTVNLLEGLVLFSSYRDPQIIPSLEAFRRVLETAAKEGIPKKSIDQAVLTSVGREIRPLVPSEKGNLGFKRWLYGISDQFREERRELLLKVDSKMLSRAAEEMLQEFKKHSAVVLTNRDMVKDAAKVLSGFGENSTTLPL
ncbi:MAG: insulinase family protein [Spirochaetia bacterium]|nr:insulinase family protein [Spirochaetia bacterium]